MIELDPFQQEAVEEAVSNYPTRSYKPLFMGTGVGKSIIYAKIAECIGFKIQKRTGKMPITWLVTIKSAKLSQVKKIKLADSRIQNDSDIMVLDGDENTRRLQIGMLMTQPPLWLITNYDQLRLHPEEFMTIAQNHPVILILDESDLIQNGTSDRSTIATALAVHAAYRVPATASAVKNKVDSLYAQLRACDPTDIHYEDVLIAGKWLKLPLPKESSYWGSQSEFEERYAVFGASGQIIGSRNIPELHRRLEDFGASIVDADDVLNIEVEAPDFQTIELYAEAWVVYNMVKTGILEWADDTERAFQRGDGQTKSRIKLQLLSQINYARRICDLAPQTFHRILKENRAKRALRLNGDDGLLERLNLSKIAEYVGGNAKVDNALEYVRAFDGNEGGLAVYSEWTAVLDEFERSLNGEKQRLGYGRITGDVKPEERERTLEGVAKGTIKLVTLSDAGGRSNDLQGLNKLLVLTPPWTHTQVHQAFGRVKRRGQELPIQIIYLTAENTIESKRMMPVLSRKGGDANQIMFGRRGRKADPLFGIDSLYDIVGWL